MEYLLVMSLSGSTMVGLYLLLKCLLKDKVSARLYYLLLKEAVLFFLIPLPFLKGWYRELIRIIMPGGRQEGVEIPVKWTRYVVHVGEKTYVNSYGIIQTAVVAVWLLIVCFLMARLFLKYFRGRRLLLKYEAAEMTGEQRAFLERLKKQYGVRRPVILCQGPDGDHTMTFGVISCPNVHNGGMAFGTSAKAAAEVTREVKKVTTKPVFIKLSPNVTDIVEIAKACEENGADGLTLINTLLGMRIDVHRRRPVIANKIGGFSGRAIFPLALRMVWQVAGACNIPVMGCGGVATAEDVIEMMMAGAKAVQVGAENLRDPFACKRIIESLPDVMTKLGIRQLSKIERVE